MCDGLSSLDRNNLVGIDFWFRIELLVDDVVHPVNVRFVKGVYGGTFQLEGGRHHARLGRPWLIDLKKFTKIYKYFTFIGGTLLRDHYVWSSHIR